MKLSDALGSGTTSQSPGLTLSAALGGQPSGFMYSGEDFRQPPQQAWEDRGWTVGEKIPQGVKEAGKQTLLSPLAAIEGAGAVGGAMLSFPPAVAIGAGEVLKGTVAGDPVGGFASAREEMDKFMEAYGYHPKTTGGQAIAEYAGKPFELLHGGTSALVQALGGGEKESKAATAAIDMAMLAIPAGMKLRQGKKITSAEAEEVKAKVREEVGKAAQQEGVSTDIMTRAGEVIDLREGPDGSWSIWFDPEALPKKLESGQAQLPAPKAGILPQPKRAVEGRKVGVLPEPQRQLEAPATESVLSTSKKSSIPTESGVVYDGKMEGIPGVTDDLHNFTVTLEDGRQPSFSIAGEVTPEKLKAEVERVKGEFGSEEVSTPEFTTWKMARGEGYELNIKRRYKSLEAAQAKAKEGQEVIKVGESYRIADVVKDEFQSFDSLDAAELAYDIGSEIPKAKAEIELAEAGDGFTVVKVGDKYHRAWDKVGDEVYGRKPVVEVETTPSDNLLEGLREMDEGVSREDMRLLRELEQESGVTGRELVREADAKLAAELEAKRQAELTGQGGSSFSPEQLMDLYRDYVVKKAESWQGKEGKQPKTSNEIGLVDSEFTGYDTPELAQEAASRLGGEVIGPDPKTGKYYVYDSMKDIDSVSWEREFVDPDIGIVTDRSGETPTQSFSDSAMKKAWDLLSSEEGFVEFGGWGKKKKERVVPFKGKEPNYSEINSLRAARYNIERMIQDAEASGKSFRDYVSSKFSADPELVSTLNKWYDEFASGRLDKKLKELDPVVESYFHPEGELVDRGKIVVNKKSGINAFIPITKADVKWLKDRIKEHAWDQGKIGGYMKTFETVQRQFERYKAEDIFFDFIHQKRKLGDFINSEVKWVEDLQKQFTPKERRDMSIYAMSLQPELKHMFQGLDKIEVPTMSTRQLEALAEFRRRYDRHFDHINYIRTHVGRRPIPKIENYFTVQRMINDMYSKGGYRGLTKLTKAEIAEHYRQTVRDFNKYSKSRVNSKLPITFDIFGNYARYVNHVGTEMYISPVAAKARRLATYKWGEVKMGGKGQIVDKKVGLANYNRDFANILLDWADNIEGINKKKQSFYANHPQIAKAERVLGANIVKAVLAYNVSSALKQPGAFIGTMAVAGELHTAKGLAMAAANGGRKLFGKSTRAGELSDMLAVRQADYYIDALADMWQKGIIGKTGYRMSKAGMIPLEMFDAFTANASWYAFESKARSMGMSPKEAIRFADREVGHTQAVNVKGSVSPVKDVPVLGLSTLLGNFAINDFNFIARDLLGIKNPDISKIDQVKKVARYAVYGYLLGQLYQQFGIEGMFPDPVGSGQETLDETGSIVNAIGSGTLELAEKLPLLGGSLKFRSSLLGLPGQLASDVPEAFEDLGKAIAEAEKGRFGDKFKSSALKAGKVGATVAGVPGAWQAAKSARTAERGGTPWEIAIGRYIPKKKSSGRTRRASRGRRVGR